MNKRYLLTLFLLISISFSLVAKDNRSLSDDDLKYIRHSVDCSYVIAKSLPDQHHKVELYIQIVKRYAEVDEWKRAINVAQELKNEGIYSGYIRVISEIIVSYAKQKRFDRVVKTLNFIKDKRRQLFALENVALLLIQNKDYQSALYIIRQIKVQLKKDFLYKELIGVYLQNDLIEDAIRLASKIQNLKDKSEVYFNIVRKLTEKNNLTTAYTHLSSITLPKLYDQALKEIIKGIAANKEFERAKRLAQTISTIEYKVDAYIEIISSLADSGQYESAVQLADELSAISPDYAEVLFAVVGIKCREGNIDEAIDTAKYIRNDVLFFEAIELISNQLILTGDFESAFTLLDQNISNRLQRNAMKIRLASEMGKSRQSYHFALLLLKQINPIQTRSKALYEYVRYFSKFNFHTKTVRVIESIEETDIRYKAANEVIDLYIQNGKWDWINEMTTLIKDETTRAKVLNLVAQIQFKKDHRSKEATDFFNSARKLVDKIDSRLEKIDVLINLVDTQVKYASKKEANRLLDRAYQIYQQLQKNDQTEVLLKRIIYFYSELGQYTDAFQLVLLLSDIEKRAQVLADLPFPKDKNDRYKISLMQRKLREIANISINS